MALPALCAAVVALHPHPSQYGVQQWEISTLRERIHKGSVQKIGIHSSQSSVEVLDVNGIVRRVHIFPEVTPVLMSDMRESHVPFVVIQDHEPSPLVPFVTSFLMTLLVVCVVGELGMMWDLIYAIANVGIGFYILIFEVN